MDICTITPKLSFLLSLILILFVFTSSDNSKDKEECAESLVGLATCLPYVGGTTKAKAPTPDCCSGLKQVLKTNKKCLCVVIKDRNDPDLGLNINVRLVLGLPDVCNAPANISQCPALLNLAPNSTNAQIFYQLGQKSNNATTVQWGQVQQVPLFAGTGPRLNQLSAESWQPWWWQREEMAWIGNHVWAHSFIMSFDHVIAFNYHL